MLSLLFCCSKLKETQAHNQNELALARQQITSYQDKLDGMNVSTRQDYYNSLASLALQIITL